MDLHTIVENLHKGKKSISSKEFSTILQLSEISPKDIHLVGERYAHLAYIKEHNSLLISQKGFVLTHQGIILLLQENNVLKNILSLTSSVNLQNLKQVSNDITTILSHIEVSELLKVQLTRAYSKLLEENTSDSTVLKAKLSISTSNNSTSKTFIPKNITYITNKEELFQSIIELLTNFYSYYSMYSRLDLGIVESDLSIAIGFEEVQNSIASGVCSSIEYTSGHSSIISIHSTFQEEAFEFRHTIPFDLFEVYKHAIINGKSGLISTKIAQKSHIYDLNKGLKKVNLEQDIRSKTSLSSSQIKSLSKIVLDLEEYFKSVFKTYSPFTIYFSISHSSKIRIHEIQFEHEDKYDPSRELVTHELIEDTFSKSELLASGIGVGNTITHGNAKWVKSDEDLQNITPESIIIVNRLKDNWQTHILKAKALIVQKGDELSLEAHIAYEFSLPTILQTHHLEHKIKDGDFLTLDISKERAEIYSGLKRYKIKSLGSEELEELYSSKFEPIELYQHSNPHHVLEKSHLPHQGEFITNIFDLITFQELKEIQYADSGDTHNRLNIKSQKAEILLEKIEELLYTKLSKIIISRYPHSIWINLSSFSTVLYNLTIAEKEYKKVLGTQGILRVLLPEFEKNVAFILKIISRIEQNLAIDSVHVYVDNVQQKKEILGLKGLLQKYKYTKKIGGVFNIGAIINHKEIVPFFDLIACDMSKLRTACGDDNVEAIVSLIHFITSSKHIKRNQTEIGLYGVSSKDYLVLNELMYDSIDFMTCEYSDIIPMYSYIISRVSTIHSKEKKFKNSIKLK